MAKPLQPPDLQALRGASVDQIHKALAKTTWSFHDLLDFALQEKPETEARFYEALLRCPIPPRGTRSEGPSTERADFLAIVNNLGIHYLEHENDPARALRFLRGWSKFARENPFIAMAMTLASVALGDHDQALKWLEVCARNGYPRMAAKERDQTLEALAKLPRFKAIYKWWHREGFVNDGYEVDLKKIEKIFPREFPAPKLLLGFAALARRLPYGSIGYFTMQPSYPYFPKRHSLGSRFVEFMNLGEGSGIAFWRSGERWDKHPAIVILGSEGEYSPLAGSLEEFLLKLSKRKTGEYDLDGDDDDDDAEEEEDRRGELAAWLEERKVKVPARKARRPDFARWIKERLG